MCIRDSSDGGLANFDTTVVEIQRGDDSVQTILWDGFIQTASNETIHFGITSYHDCSVWIKPGLFTWQNHENKFNNNNNTFFPEENIILSNTIQDSSYLTDNGFTLVCSDQGSGSIDYENYGEVNVDYTIPVLDPDTLGYINRYIYLSLIHI